jgi:hypothetical protein
MRQASILGSSASVQVKANAWLRPLNLAKRAKICQKVPKSARKSTHKVS